MAQMLKAYKKSPVHHMVRQIAPVTNPQMGYTSVDDTDAEISSMLLQGYRLVSTHFLGAQKDPAANLEYYGVMYIFQLEPGELDRIKSEIARKPEKVE